MSPTHEPARVTAGVPAGGQFAATAHSDTVPALAAADTVKNPEWHQVAAELVAAGSTPEEARCKLVFVLSYRMAESLRDHGLAQLGRGNQLNAAMIAIAAASIRDLPRRIHHAAGVQARALEAVKASRRSLSSGGGLLDGFHPTGRQPVFQGADEVLADFEEFLTTTPQGA